MSTNLAIEIKNISKSFGSVKANKNINLDVRRGEILALLGENGSGKTTLVNMLSGIYFPDSGEILVNGKEVVIKTPRDAYALGIGMIHQHFKLVDVLTAAENIVLGLSGSFFINWNAIASSINEIAKQYGFEIDPWKKVYNMSVSEKQTVEIIKVLYRGADILILDEPTAVLTPQEIEKLFNVLKKMKEDGKAIVIITHKLGEVLAISDRVSVLRRGECVSTVDTTDATLQSLTEGMVGRTINLSIKREIIEHTTDRLLVKNLTTLDVNERKTLDNVSFILRGGEIMGVAGIAGSGQKELCEALTGLMETHEGSIIFIEEDGKQVELNGLTASEIAEKGVRKAFVPEDRLGMGLVANMDMIENMMLKNYYEHHSVFVDRKSPKNLAEKLIKKLGIITPGTSTPVRRLSGGNVQKVLLGREMSSKPSVLIVAYPTRGLDINSTLMIYDLLNKQKMYGVAILFVGEDLDVLLELCDRILVLRSGCVSGIVDAQTVTKEKVGLLMTSIHEEEGSDND